MGHRLRTRVPAILALLNPALPDYTILEVKDREKRMNDARCFNKRHGTRNLEPLTAGEEVWITDAQVQGTVVSTHDTPRLYLVQGPQGMLRRKRHHLVQLQTNTESGNTEEPVGENLTIPEPVPPETTSPRGEDSAPETAYKFWERD